MSRVLVTRARDRRASVPRMLETMRQSDLFSYFALALAAVPACTSSGTLPEFAQSCEPTATVTVPLSSLTPSADAGAGQGALPLLDASEEASTPEDAGSAPPPRAGDLLPFDVCQRVCGEGMYWAQCDVTLVTESQATVFCSTYCTGGRRPAGYETKGFEGASPLAAHFATMAGLEEASVRAFRWLSDDLAAHGAPRRLVRACRRAAREEIRHARMMRGLLRPGGSAVRVVAPPRPARPSLEELARENVVEGCVRETYGALLAHWQSRTATDPRVREAMRRIARDETRHAALSWSIDAWARSRLSAGARARVEKARRGAVRELVAGALCVEGGDAMRAAGLPSARQGRALAEALEKTLWAEAA